MNRASLLGIFAGCLCLPLFVAACGDGPADSANNGGAPSTGGVSGTSAAGSSAGGTVPGAGNGSGGSVAGSGNEAGVGNGGVAGTGTGGSPAGTGGLGGAGPAGAGGAAASGGVGGAAGTSGTSGAAGGGQGGSGGTGGTVSCTITATHTRSTAIPTVEIVTFTTDLAGISSAHIDFGLAGSAPTMTAPVSLTEPNYRTLLLGMKGARDYAFRVVASSAAGSCTSQEYTLTTGAIPTSVPRITRTVMNATAQDRGFIITSGGVAGSGGGMIPAYIIDADGDVVWWAAAPASTSRARMSYDGKDMYMMALNVQNQSMNGEMRRVSMDGMTTMNNIAGLSGGHHDFTVLPDNGIAVIIWSNMCSSIVERSASGTLTTIVANVNTLYRPNNECHTNAIQYYPASQTYTLSDRNVNLFVKIRRTGQLVWQFGGANPMGQAFTGAQTWSVNHGHHYLADGTFLFFNNGPMGAGGMSAALSYSLNETTWVATKSSWEYRVTGVNSAVLSDVQRLPNGNTLVTYSTAGQIHEVAPSGTLVQRLQTTSFGYAEFRKSLYGPPLR